MYKATAFMETLFTMVEAWNAWNQVQPSELSEERLRNWKTTLSFRKNCVFPRLSVLGSRNERCKSVHNLLLDGCCQV